MEKLVEKELSDAELQQKIRVLEKRLEDQNNLMNSIFDAISSPLYIVNIQDYTIIKANKACKLSSLSEPITCYRFSHKTDEPCQTQNHPCPLEIMKNTKKPVNLEHIHTDPLGNLGYFEIIAIPVFNEFGEMNQMIEYTVDITKRKEAEQELKQSEEKFRTLFNYSSDPIFILDLNGKFLEISEIACNTLGYTKDELMKLTPNNIKLCNENIATQIEALKQFGYLTHNTDYFRRDGVKIPLEINSKMINYDGKSAIMCIARDISERQKYENMQNQFLSTISHELRTPLAVIIQSLNVLKKYDVQLSASQKENLIQTMLRNANLQSHMIEDILFLARIDEDQLLLEWKEYNLLKVLDQVLIQMKPYIEAKNISIEHQIPDSVTSYGDPQKIGLICRIIIDNAIKYSNPKSFLKIEVMDHYVGPYNPKALEGILLTFTDNGYGIKPEDLPHVFDKFYRAKEVVNIPGTGLGLKIARVLAKVHDGGIYIESNLGVGTKVSVFLPRVAEIPELQQLEGGGLHKKN